MFSKLKNLSRTSKKSGHDPDGMSDMLGSLFESAKNASPEERRRLTACMIIAGSAQSYQANGDMRPFFENNENFRSLGPDRSGAPAYDDLKTGLHVVVAANFLELQVIQPNPDPVLPDFLDMVERSLDLLGHRVGDIRDGKIPKSRDFDIAVKERSETASVSVGPVQTPFRTDIGENLNGLIVLLLIKQNQDEGAD